jgi:hypothetical protein
MRARTYGSGQIATEGALGGYGRGAGRLQLLPLSGPDHLQL